MKKIFIIFILIIPAVVYGQQFPVMEGYCVNPFNLSPAYSGIRNAKYLFVDYLSDWSGFDGAPTTCQISYSDKFRDKIGLGGRFIFDRTDIFKHTLILGTYTYEVTIANGHVLNFGLSAGFYRNSVDVAKYYNDPNYVQDLSLASVMGKSKIKFATDISALYRYKQAEAGILFSNLMFGNVRYQNLNMRYKPLKNYQLHSSYSFLVDDKWCVKPTILLRGGQNIPIMFEISPAIFWKNRFWGTILFRSGGTFGAGFGGELIDGIIVNYSHRIIADISLYTYSCDQLTIGIKISNFTKNKKIRE